MFGGLHKGDIAIAPRVSTALLVSIIVILALWVLSLRSSSPTTYHEPFSVANEQAANTNGSSTEPGRHAAEEAMRVQMELDYQRSRTASLDFLEKNPAEWGTDNLWFLLGPFYNCHFRRRIGVPIDGGKWICNDPMVYAQPQSQKSTRRTQPTCYVYSLGSGGLISFEQAIHDMYPRCLVHTFDHTVDDDVAQKTNAIPGVTFHPLGVVDSAQLSVSGPKFTSIRKSMKEEGITWLDVLKIDIEGGEWGVLLELLDHDLPMPFTQILIEIHTVFGIPVGTPVAEILQRFFRGMDKAGYRIFATEPNYNAAGNTCIEFSFIKVDNKGRAVGPPGVGT